MICLRCEKYFVADKAEEYSNREICKDCQIQLLIDNLTLKSYKIFCRFKKDYSIRDYLEYRRTIKAGFVNEHQCYFCGEKNQKKLSVFFVRKVNIDSLRIKRAIGEYKEYRFPILCKKCYNKIANPWSKDYSECIRCGKTDSKYGAKGLCRKCCNKEAYKERYKWKGKYKKCIKCGKTDSRHESGGLCRRCYSEKQKKNKI